MISILFPSLTAAHSYMSMHECACVHMYSKFRLVYKCIYLSRCIDTIPTIACIYITSSIDPNHTKNMIHNTCLYRNSKQSHSKEPKHPKPTIPCHLPVNKINHRIANPHQTKVPVVGRQMMRPMLIQRNHEPNSSQRLDIFVMNR